jgi:ATP-dependent helicase HrpB
MAQFVDRIEKRMSVDWDPRREAVAAENVSTLGALVVHRTPVSAPDPQAVTAALVHGIARKGVACLPWTKKLRRWQERVCFLRRVDKDADRWPDVSDANLAETLTMWLVPYVAGIFRLKDLAAKDLQFALHGMLSNAQKKALDILAPTHLRVPSGSRIRLDYAGEVPVLAVRLQEMFGADKTPAVAGGRQPLLIHLLSPAGRPVQVTQDLAGFWLNGYPQVKKELKGRYPKHHWPDDPLSAKPTAQAKRR